MSPITDLKLSPSFSQGHTLYWKLDPFYIVTGQEELELEVSGAPDFSEIRNTIPAILTDFFVVDKSNTKQAHGKDTFYRLKITIGPCVEYSKTVAFVSARYHRRDYVIAREIQRKELLRARKFTGAEMYLIKRKLLGKVEVCAPDIDPITELRITNESTSLTSGFRYGYFDPLRLYVSYEDYATSRESSQSGLGLQQRTTQAFRAVSFPAVDTFDILVDPTNDQRYEVTKQAEYVFPGTDLVVVQEITASLIPPTSEIYKLPIVNIV